MISSAALALTLSCSSAPLATWTAQQTTTGVGLTRQTTISYGFHRLRIDYRQERTILDFPHQELIHIDLNQKKYTVVGLHDLTKQRKHHRRQFESLVPNMPSSVRTQLRHLLTDAYQTERASLRVHPLGRQASYAKLPCKLVTWSMGNHSGEACLAPTPPIRWTSLRDDSRSWVAATNGMGAALASDAFLQLLDHGFPLMFAHRAQLGRQAMRMKTVLTHLRAIPLRPAHFEPPRSFHRIPPPQ
ncbi:MAG: hypothetical protein KTR25_08790 [Myxococcales bacterium]|nr:hypothetical protein [Myxococcales bacterium]